MARNRLSVDMQVLRGACGDERFFLTHVPSPMQQQLDLKVVSCGRGRDSIVVLQASMFMVIKQDGCKNIRVKY